MTVANGHDEPSAADVSAKINLAQSSRLAKVGSHDVTGGIELDANAVDDFALPWRPLRPGASTVFHYAFWRRREAVLCPRLHPTFRIY